MSCPRANCCAVQEPGGRGEGGLKREVGTEVYPLRTGGSAVQGLPRSQALSPGV